MTASTTATREPGRRLIRSRRSLRFAAALAALALVCTMVMRASFALTGTPEADLGEVDGATGGVIALTADAQGPLFDEVHLSPGETIAACIRVDVRGDVDPDPVALRLGDLAGSVALAERLAVVVHRGQLADDTAGCPSFRPSRVVADGSLLALTSGDVGIGPDTWDPPIGAQHAWYRIAVTLDPQVSDDLQGTRTEAGFHWSTVGRPETDASLEEVVVRPDVLLGATFVPLLSLLVLVVVALVSLAVRRGARRRTKTEPPSPRESDPEW